MYLQIENIKLLLSNEKLEKSPPKQIVSVV